MATYEFTCVDCENIRVVLESIHHKVPEQKCEKCGYVMARVFNNPGVIFNAQGFYSSKKGV